MPVLDTDALAPHERSEAIVTHMREVAYASHVVVLDPATAFMRTDVHTLGDVRLVRLHRSGLHMEVTRERDDVVPAVALTLGTAARAHWEQFGHVVRQRRGVVEMMELHRPHTSNSEGNPGGWSLTIPLTALRLPAQTVTRARPALARSPLQAVYAQHLRALTRRLAEPATDRTGHALTVGQLSAAPGLASTALTRALLSTAAGDQRTAREALRESLLPRVEVFVLRHLRDPGLSPSTIAAAHHISVRLLYLVLAEAGVPLEQWVIEERLAGAHRELGSAAGRRRSVTAVAMGWGFASPAHFSRRFLRRYGMTPQEWQRLAHSHGPRT
ncbi:helix-turn-helix domain-containing protein [Aquipuribacter sp. SD81]|uniref:helix-turn-helix domain-containing protein n=1 Tax=Aquipuribacter sp. SD81 TaxID=3127703 RepID=UPI0030197A68